MRSIVTSKQKNIGSLLGRLLLVSVLCSCGDNTQPEPEPTPASGDLGLVRAVSWPGGGRELTVRVQDSDRLAVSENLAGLFRVELSNGANTGLQTSVTRKSLSPGFTAILLRPAASASDAEEVIAQLRTFIDSREAQEKIGLYLWQSQVRQVASFTSDRERLISLAQFVLSEEPDADPLSEESAFLQVELETIAIGGKGIDPMRSVVVVGPASTLKTVPRALPFVAGLANAAKVIDDFAEFGNYRVAICGPTSQIEGTVVVDGREGLLPFALGETLPEEVESECSIANIESGARDYAQELELVFSTGERQIYEERVAALSKSDFAVSIRLGIGKTPVPASAHLRGKGTLGCLRKSYTLEIDGPARFLLPDSRSDEYYLLSMCADDRYVNQYTANQLMAELGLFSLKFRYVTLSLDGESKGVYLLLEKPREELVRDNSRVRAVIRRRFAPPDEQFEFKYNELDPGKVVDEYNSILDDLVNANKIVDVDQYLLFLAMMTVYQNGDYIDEIWLIATESVKQDGATGNWFEMMAWDNDDLFTECHYTGRYAFVDPNELVHCAESKLGHALLSNPDMYARYVDVLEDLLVNKVPPSRFDEAVKKTSDSILPIFDDARISGAMVRLVADVPSAAEPEFAKLELTQKLDELSGKYRARHQLLLTRIAAYRESL